MPKLVSETEGDPLLQKVHELLGKPRYVIVVYEVPGEASHFHILLHGLLSMKEVIEIRDGLLDVWERGDLVEMPEGVSE